MVCVCVYEICVFHIGLYCMKHNASGCETIKTKPEGEHSSKRRPYSTSQRDNAFSVHLFVWMCVMFSFRGYFSAVEFSSSMNMCASCKVITICAPLFLSLLSCLMCFICFSVFFCNLHWKRQNKDMCNLSPCFALSFIQTDVFNCLHMNYKMYAIRRGPNVYVTFTCNENTFVYHFSRHFIIFKNSHLYLGSVVNHFMFPSIIASSEFHSIWMSIINDTSLTKPSSVIGLNIKISQTSENEIASKLSSRENCILNDSPIFVNHLSIRLCLFTALPSIDNAKISASLHSTICSHKNTLRIVLI